MTEPKPRTKFWMTITVESETNGKRRKVVEVETRLRTEHVAPDLQRLVNSVRWER